MASTGVGSSGASGAAAKRSVNADERLMAHGDQRFDPRLVASQDIRRAEIAGIRQQAFGLLVLPLGSRFLPPLPPSP